MPHEAPDPPDCLERLYFFLRRPLVRISGGGVGQHDPRLLSIRESANADGSFNSDQLQWGFALEYSLPYLQEHVKDVGLPHPFKDVIPLVEFSMNTPFDRSGQTTTGTINPGLLWESKYFQVGAEAVIPVNAHTGPNVGAIVQVQFFIDDSFPKIFGHPLFGKDDK